MPEGPSIVILREALLPFKGAVVNKADGDAAIDFNRLHHKKMLGLKSWGKHLLLCFDDFFIRIHLMMFGTYRINDPKPSPSRLHLVFKTGEVNFYTCLVALIEGKPGDLYDWETDIMSEAWSPAKAENTLKNTPMVKICDVLLNQEVFSGVGNIIKNESLFNTRMHPESLVKNIPPKKIRELIRKTLIYSLNFYTWKMEGLLSKNWHVYEKKICPRCEIPLEKTYLGKTRRLSFFCHQCQILF